MSSRPIYVIDAFTIDGNKAFTGNPAAVYFLEYDDDINDETKQKIASQMNLSETAFVSFGWTSGVKLSPSEDGPQVARRTLRWFTPVNEVVICGHATVASAKAMKLFQLEESCEKIEFESKFSGKLGAGLSKDGLITLDFPANPLQAIALNDSKYPWLPEFLKTVLGDEVESLSEIQHAPRLNWLLLVLKDEMKAEGLREKIKPNFQQMMEINTNGFIRDVIVTVKGEGNGKPDFYSRFFAPFEGINEDPVTGSAHTILTPYWTKVLQGGDGKELFARQHSERGGDLKCTVKGDRVTIAGDARLVLKGEIYI